MPTEKKPRTPRPMTMGRAIDRILALDTEQRAAEASAIQDVRSKFHQRREAVWSALSPGEQTATVNSAVNSARLANGWEPEGPVVDAEYLDPAVDGESNEDFHDNSQEDATQGDPLPRGAQPYVQGPAAREAMRK